MAPIVRGRKGEFKDLLDQLDRQGFRARVDGEMMDLSEPVLLDRRKNHAIEAVIDRILLKPPAAMRRHLPAGKPSVEKRLEPPWPRRCNWQTGWCWWPSRAAEEQLFSSSMACPDCGLDVPKLEPRSFSFNSTFGACPECHGLGSLYDLDPAKVITDWSKPLLDGGLGPGSSSQYLLEAAAPGRGPVQDRPEDCRSKICRRSSSTFWSTGPRRTRPRAQAFTGFCLFCATRSKRRAATAIAST